MTDSFSFAIVALHRHNHAVCMIKWVSESLDLTLASVDTSGVIIVWNVTEGTPLTVILSIESKNITFMHWICLCKTNTSKNTDTNSNGLSIHNRKQLPGFYKNGQKSTKFLLTFYSQSNCFVLYDAELGDAVVKWNVTFKIEHIAYNPFFEFNRSCDGSVHTLIVGFQSWPHDDRVYLGQARLHHADFTHPDLSKKEPKSLNLNFDIYALGSLSQDAGMSSSNFSKHDLITKLDNNQRSKVLVNVNDVTQSLSTPPNGNESYVQLQYHQAVRNQIFIVFPREIYLVDLSTETIVNVIAIERNCSGIVKIFPTLRRNAFYIIHEAGNVSFRLFQKKVIHERSSEDGVVAEVQQSSLSEETDSENSFINIGYINLCQSEAIRLTKQNKVFGVCLAPFTETSVAFLLSSGRIVIKSLICTKSFKQDEPVHISHQTVFKPFLSDFIHPKEYQLGSSLSSSDSSDSLIKLYDSVAYKLMMTNLIGGLNLLPTVIRMCPPLTLQNIKQHKPFLAVGDSSGQIQVWLLENNSSVLHREFSVHSYPVQGIEWTGLNSLVSFAYPTINSPSHNHSSVSSAFGLVTHGSGSSSGRVTNELVHTNICDGQIMPFRTNRVNDQSPIETIKVSHLKQYLIVLFKLNDPFEIWDINTFSLLRVMPKNMINITAVEWSPICGKRKPKTSDFEELDSNQKRSSPTPLTHLKENFIVTNRNLFHFSIEGNIVRELACIPPDSDSGHVSVTSIAWKNDQVLLGDASGTINIWDLKRKNSTQQATFRSCIKKIRFAPGRGNLKCLILYADYGVDIGELNDFRIVAQLKYPRDMSFKIIDIDWASSDLPIFCTADGFIFISDLKLKTYSSPLRILELADLDVSSVFKPCALSSGDMLNSILTSGLFKETIFRDVLFSFQYKQSTENEQEIDVKQFVESQMNLSKLLCNFSDYDFWLLLESILFSVQLDNRLDLFLNEKQFRNLQREKLLLLESNRKTYSHACHAYRLNLRLKNFHRAVQILLETESYSHPSLSSGQKDSTFYIDALKACLIASIQSDATKDDKCKKAVSKNTDSSSPDEGEVSVDISEITDSSESNAEDTQQYNSKDAVAPVVKLVATSLIANGHIQEGVELLNFISKTCDSCRYLQSAEQWLESVWMAKVS